MWFKTTALHHVLSAPVCLTVQITFAHRAELNRDARNL